VSFAVTLPAARRNGRQTWVLATVSPSRVAGSRPAMSDDPAAPTVLASGEPVPVRSLDQLVRIVTDEPNSFLRYSHGPASDDGAPSVDYESGLPMPGLSVVPLHPPPWWRRPRADWIARQVCKYRHLADDDPRRYAWIATGRVTGHGPDGEPLLDDVQPLGRLEQDAVEQAQSWYQRHFEVGRTSLGSA
jgi:hypothetical protein